LIYIIIKHLERVGGGGYKRNANTKMCLYIYNSYIYLNIIYMYVYCICSHVGICLNAWSDNKPIHQIYNKLVQ